MHPILKSIASTIGLGLVGFALTCVFVLPILVALAPNDLVADVATIISTGLVTYGIKQLALAWT